MQLQIKNLSKRFPNGVQALDNVNIDIEQGEFVTLIGLSGSGKSTLLRCINRLVDPTNGTIQYDQHNITDLKSKDLRIIRRDIGMIFQQFNLIKNMSALMNVATGKLGYLSFGQTVSLNWNKKVLEEAREKLARVELLKFADEKVRNLSGGQQQRVAIARTLMQNPKIILADEPVASLDPITSDTVLSYLKDINSKEKITVICSMHFIEFIKKYGDRVVALKSGEKVFDGSVNGLNDKYLKDVYTSYSESNEI